MCALSKTGWRKHCSVAVPSLVCFFAFLFSTFVRGYVVYSLCISSVQFSCSVVCDPLWPHGLQHPRLPCPSPSPRACSNSCPSSWWCHPTISSCHPLILLPSIFPRIRVFSKESVLCIRWPKYWSFNVSPSNEYSGLISFRIDWFDLLSVQGTLKSLLQHHSSKASTYLKNRDNLTYLQGWLWELWMINIEGLEKYLAYSKFSTNVSYYHSYSFLLGTYIWGIYFLFLMH